MHMWHGTVDAPPRPGRVSPVRLRESPPAAGQFDGERWHQGGAVRRACTCS